MAAARSARTPPPLHRSAWVALPIAFALAACAGAATTDPPGPRWQDLAPEYQALQQQRGHFDGADWNPEIDRFDGRKHRLMRRLAAALAQTPPTLDELTAALGPPDARWRAGAGSPQGPLQSPLPAELRPRAGDTLLWYRWRGNRDGLVLLIREQRLAQIAWSHALE